MKGAKVLKYIHTSLSLEVILFSFLHFKANPSSHTSVMIIIHLLGFFRKLIMQTESIPENNQIIASSACMFVIVHVLDCCVMMCFDGLRFSCLYSCSPFSLRSLFKGPVFQNLNLPMSTISQPQIILIAFHHCSTDYMYFIVHCKIVMYLEFFCNMVSYQDTRLIVHYDK